MVRSHTGDPAVVPQVAHSTPSLAREQYTQPCNPAGETRLTRKTSAGVAKCYFCMRKAPTGVARKEIGVQFRTRKTPAGVARKEEDGSLYA